MKESPSSQSSQQGGCIGIILRTLWLIAGNVGLAVLVLFIVLDRHPLFALHDFLFWGIVILLIIIRYVDIAYFHGSDSYGDPATIQHWRRYTALLLAISLAGWALAHGISYYYAEH